ncbi:hypothetical protein D3C84_232870 [compost metagenome]
MGARKPDRAAVPALDRLSRAAPAAGPAQCGEGHAGPGGGGAGCRQRGHGRGTGDAQAAHGRSPGAAQARQARRQRAAQPVRVALVCDHRAAGFGQDHGTGQFGIEFPPCRADGRRSHSRCGRHAQLRLVVHQRGRAAGYRWPLHHPGQSRGGGQGRLAGISRSAEEPAQAAAHRWRLHRHQPVRPAAGQRQRTGQPRPCHPRPGAGTLCPTRRAFPDLRDADQVRPGSGVHGILRRLVQGGACPGLGRDLPPGRRQER